MAKLSAICGNTATVNSGLFLAYSFFMEYKGFATRLKALQIESDAPKTQYKFAEWLGLSKSFVSELLRGEKLPSMDLAIVLADKFDVSIDWLMRGKGSKRITDAPELQNYINVTDLTPAQIQETNEFIAFKRSQNNTNKALTTPIENVGGGGG